MYTPRGFMGRGAELGDVEVVADGERLHLFHLTLPNHDLVAHVVSKDGLAWQPRPPALRTGDPGAADDDMIWTVSVAEQGGAWQMLYTALSRAEQGQTQRVLRARSADLETWEKAASVAFEANPTCYETQREGWPWVCWRDPKPVATDEGWLCVVCARDTTGAELRRGVVGLARSQDLRRWTVEPPLLAPRSAFELECPQLFQVGPRWYLTAARLDDRSQRYWTAAGPRGPFHTPATDRLAPAGHYAARVLRWGERDALFCWHDAADAAPGRTARRAVPSPLLLEARDDGTLRCAPWPEWSRYVRGDSHPVAPERAGLFEHPAARAKLDGTTLEGEVDAGAEAWPLAGPGAPLRFDCRLALRAARGGLLLGGGGARDGLFVEIEPAERRVRLVSWGDAADPAGRWPRRRVLQEASLGQPWSGAAALSLRLVDGELELALDGEVHLATLVDEPAGDAVTLAAFVEGGRIAVREGRWTPLGSPAALAGG